MSKAFLVGILLAVFVANALAGRSHGPLRVSVQNSQGDIKHNESPENKSPNAAPSLGETAQRFMTAVRSGPPLQLLDYWSDDGVTFGIDGEPVSKAEFRKQVERKAGLFCFFFDSNCLRQEVNDARHRSDKSGGAAVLYSLRDLFRKAKSVAPKAARRKESDNQVGDLKIRIENGDDLKGNQQKELEFAFAFENGTWKLTSVIYN